MNKFQEQVKEFHEAFDVPVHTTPQVSIAKDRALLRAKLIYEEAVETIQAMGCYFDECGHIANGIEAEEFNMVEVADGIADTIYVLCGAALEFGIDIQPIFNEVHRSNMSKAWTEEEIKNLPAGATATPIDGLLISYAVKRKDGKILKSFGYSPANISKVLDQQRKGAK